MVDNEDCRYYQDNIIQLILMKSSSCKKLKTAKWVEQKMYSAKPCDLSWGVVMTVMDKAWWKQNSKIKIKTQIFKEHFNWFVAAL